MGIANIISSLSIVATYYSNFPVADYVEMQTSKCNSSCCT